MIPVIPVSIKSRNTRQALQDEVDQLRQQLAEVQATSQTQVKHSDALSVALQKSEQSYDSLFSQLPRGLQEEDYSSIKKAIDKLQAEGVHDLRKYLLNNKEFLKELVSTIEITNVNQAMLDIHQEDSLEKWLEVEDAIDDWWDEQWADYYASELVAFAENKGIYHDQRLDFNSDGSDIEISMIAVIIRGSEDTWEKVITVFEDVTARNRFEAALVEAKSIAEKANLAKTEFLSNMSHELRTPLNAILGFSHLFEYDQNLGKQQQSNARAINNAGQHLLTLIDEILDLSRIEAGHVDLLIEAVSLEAVIKDSLAWVTEMAESRKVSIDFNPGACRGTMVDADAIRLKQVFLNLITNAVKYNRENGSVSIACRPCENDCIRVSITDTGLGIAPDRLSDLFKPFNRLGAEFSGVEGTGIGLVITRQLVDLMGGELDVDSSPDVGSTFTIQLKTNKSKPIDNKQASAKIDLPPVVKISAPGPRPHLLIAEDNKVNQDLIDAQLKLLGYSADYADDGVAALKLWKSGNYQMLLTDIRMPKMDGYELIRQIRDVDSASAASPIIAVTANALESDIKRCLETGASDVISKPFGLDELKQILEKWSTRLESTGTTTATAPQSLENTPEEAIDLSMLTLTIGDSDELHRQLLTSYIVALPEALDDIQQAFDTRNHEQLGEYAHKLKSSSASLGAIRLANICQVLELACREGRESEINSSVPELLLAVEAVFSFVHEFCKEARGASVVEPPVRTPNNAPASKLSVLLVDDDYVLHRVTTLILNDLGVNQVQSALSGVQALEILKQMPNEIDIVICDLNMPEMDGVEFTRHLAEQQYSGTLILSSGEDIRILKTVEKLAIEHDLQVLGVLEKPVTPAKLRQLLDLLEISQIERTIPKSRVYTAAELSKAIKDGEMDMVFQPKVDVRTKQVVGVEALVRWNHSTDGLISPFEFIPLVEKYNLIFDLTQMVCRKTLQHSEQWRERGFDLNIAINISVAALNDLNWPDEIATLIEAAGLQPSTVTFEITESQVIEHIVVALDILSRLSLKRFNLSIDDFGTGYSSMEQLQRIPFSELKIDRAFVRGASEDASARAILESSVLLAKKLNMKIVAEGVETEADWNLIAELGCDQVQGYYIAKPMPADQLCEWLVEWQPGGIHRKEK